MAEPASAGSSPPSQLPLSKGSTALPELIDYLLARSRVTLHSFRRVCAMTVTHSKIQAVLRSSITPDRVQEERSDLPKDSAAQLGAEPRATMLPVSTQLHRQQQVNVLPRTCLEQTLGSNCEGARPTGKSASEGKGNFGGGTSLYIT